MNLYVCSTPYHLIISLSHLFFTREKGVIYLTTHDSRSELNFKKLEPRLKELQLVEKVIIRKRNLLLDRIKIEDIRDSLYFPKIKNYLNNGTVYIFPWNPYSLYKIGNFIFKKAKKVILVQDGSNLYSYPEPNKKTLRIKKYLYGIQTQFYSNIKTEKILVEFPDKYPEHLKDKIQEFQPKEMFKKLSKREKEIIIGLFLTPEQAIDLVEIETSNSVILLTQPLSEDGYITEEEKREMYENLKMEYQDEYKVFIKRHPRERTVYNFENAIEIQGDFPSELFYLMGKTFSKSVGICTSAVNSIEAEQKLNVDENFLKRRKNNV
jgi:hypothetical protein